MSNAQKFEFITPVGRFVQGGFDAQTTDNKGQPLVVKTGPNKGQQATRYFMAVAFRKDDPAFGAFYAILVAAGKAGYPTLFNGDQPTHPRFTFKVMDGDGVDDNGKQNNEKPGFAGHWVVKFSSSYPPKCYHTGKYDPSQQIQEPAKVIKRGFYVRVAGNCAANIGSDVPGVYVNHEMVELVAYGEEIVGGPDASKVFGGAPAPALPPGASATPLAPSGATPGGAPTPTMPTPGAMPSVPAPAAMPSVPTPPAPPAPPAGPVYTMTAAAQGASREALLGNGWTDDLLIQHGLMTKA